MLLEGENVTVFSPNGDPRDPKTDLSRLYPIPDPFHVQPFVFADILPIHQFTDAEHATLEKAYGLKLPVELRVEISVLVKKCILSLALEDRLPTWMEFDQRLTSINNISEKLIELSLKYIDLVGYNADPLDSSDGVLSVDQIMHLLLGRSKMNIAIDVGNIPQICEAELRNVRVHSRKKGRKPDRVYELFLQSVAMRIHQHKLPMVLPSNALKEKEALRKYTPFFEFTKTLIGIVREKGLAAVEESKLDAELREKSSRRLRHIVKTDGMLLDNLRVASRWARKQSTLKSTSTS